MALSGKIAVVTGAAMGIGKAITEILLQNGAKVVLLDMNETEGRNLTEVLKKEYGQDKTLFLSCNVESEEQIKGNTYKRQRKAINGVVLLDMNETEGRNLTEVLKKEYGKDKTLFLSCNVESEEQIKAAFQKSIETFGGIDILCNNAGILNESVWEKSISVNLTGVIRGTYLAQEHMSKLSGGRGGVIINTASMAGLGPLPSCPVYTATKHGVVGFTRAIAAAYTESGYGIRVNTLCPGFVQTDLFASIPDKLGQHSHLSGITQQLVDKIGVLTVSDIAKSFFELVTDETKNGEALLVLPNGNHYMPFPSFS